MSGRAKIMGAGFAGSTQSNVNVNLNTAGGYKKQGLVSRVGLNNWSNLAVKTEANGTPRGRRTIFFMNQLGGIGRGQSQFMVAGSFAKKRGAKMRPPFVFPK